MTAPQLPRRIAFVKFGGLASGGTERWLQMMAAHLPRHDFEVDYYYCDTAPYIGSDYRHAGTDPSRRRYLEDHGVRLIEFRVGAKDIRKPTHDWIDTNFWDLFDSSKHDLVQTAKAGPAEYPFHLLDLPVVEYVTLLGGVDRSPSLTYSIHLSQWQRARWVQLGGNLERSSVIPIPAEPPASTKTLRTELGIPPTALVAGFHQRPDNQIFSPIPLSAFSAVEKENRYFAMMGGGSAYRRQAQELGLKNVRFLEHSGEAARISQFLNSLDFFAHGRRDGETFGTVLAEALMHGKPCLSHRTRFANAQPETMGPAGLFAENQKHYAALLARLFEDTPLRERLSSKAKTHAEKRYTVSACANSLAEIYRGILGFGNLRPHGRSYALSPLGFLYADELERPDHIGFHVIKGEIPEEPEIDLVRFFLPHVKRFIDVGANTGLYGFLAAQETAADAKVLMIEPQPDCIETLRETIWLNNWESKVMLLPCGLAGEPGELRLHLSGTGSTFDNRFNDNVTLPTLNVSVETLDRLADQHPIGRPDFIKIDVEGFEQAVLDGGFHVLEQDRPVLFIEIADRILNRSFRNPKYQMTIETLQRHGYRVWRCTEKGLLEEAFPIREQKHLSMYLALHEVKHQQWIGPIQSWAKARRWRRLRRKSMRRFIRLAKQAMRESHQPIRLLARLMDKARRALLPQGTRASFRRHHGIFVAPGGLEYHRRLYKRFENENLFDHPANRLSKLLAGHPEVRDTAVDIGSGGGWLSARLSREFRKVIGIEPSPAAIEIAEKLFPTKSFANIEWRLGLAEERIGALQLVSPTLFVTAAVMSHLPDRAVAIICKAVNAVAPAGSLLSFSECWGPEHHEFMWHVRTPGWWQAQLPGWKLDFHGPEIENVSGRHKGIHGLKER